MVGCSSRGRRRELRFRRAERVAEALAAVTSLHEHNKLAIIRNSAKAFQISQLDLRLEIIQVRAVVFDRARRIASMSEMLRSCALRVGAEVALSASWRPDDAVRLVDLPLIIVRDQWRFDRQRRRADDDCTRRTRVGAPTTSSRVCVLPTRHRMIGIFRRCCHRCRVSLLVSRKQFRCIPA